MLDYLRDLGISHLYASPIFEARKGSPHGYDVVDPRKINPELGTEKDFENLMQKARENQLGWIQDIVPNHMALDGNNPILMDLFESGKSSPYLSFLDIDWDHPRRDLTGRLLCPFLGRPYPEALKAGEIQIGYSENGFNVNYFSLCFPLYFFSYDRVLQKTVFLMKKQLGEGNTESHPLLNILDAMKHLPPQKDKIHDLKSQLWRLYQNHSEIHRFIHKTLDWINAKTQRGFLDQLMSQQIFKLDFWKIATQRINFRRFFTVNELISLKVECEEVFNHTHGLIFKLCREEKFSGIRVDHIDGLYDPAAYLKRLRKKIGQRYLVVEKILNRKEKLPRTWPIQGTTGYEFLNVLNGIFCMRKNAEAFQSLYQNFTRQKKIPVDLVYQNKHLIMRSDMNGDMENLSRMFQNILKGRPFQKTVSLKNLKKAITEFIACFPVYRTYVDQKGTHPSDRVYIAQAIEKANQRAPKLREELTLLNQVLDEEKRKTLGKKNKEQWLHFAMRLQQYTGPLRAKGLEDTTLYIYNRLLSLNEVGGDPHHFGTALGEWHQFNQFRQKHWPHTLNASATHDTKRGEDVRARINVLSEIPNEWHEKISYWHTLNQDKKIMVKGKKVPGKNEEYFLYQTLIGSYPFQGDLNPHWMERVKNYMIKAGREGKVHTHWSDPQTSYEKALTDFVVAITGFNSFLEDFKRFQNKVAFFGMLNSLSQTLIKITAPGIPDFYQGTELWDLSLVDPDNRHPVNYEKRFNHLSEIREINQSDRLVFLKNLWSMRGDGRIKFYTIHQAHQARKTFPGCFTHGTYHPIEPSGRLKEQVVSFARNQGSLWTLTVVPRFLTGLLPEGELPQGESLWGDTTVALPSGAPSHWEDAMTGQIHQTHGKLKMSDLLKYFPVSLLMGKGKK